MRRSSERILTTITGSLPRPDDLVQMLVDRNHDKPVDEATLAARIGVAVEEIVARQVEAGLDVPSDGEQSKSDYIDYINFRAEGFGDPVQLVGAFSISDLADLPELVLAIWGEAEFNWRECAGELRYTDAGRAELQRDIDHMKRALQKAGATEGFLPAPSPGIVAFSCPNKHYASYEDYVFAIADLMHTEYKAITDAGLLVQLDAPDIAVPNHMRSWMSDEIDKRGVREFQELHVEAINRGLRGIDPERVRMHLCYANYMGPHNHDMPIRDALEPAFGANVCGINFEGANPAHAHEWRVFEDLEVPDGKVIIPGVVDTKSQVVEHPELVAQRIEQYVRLVGPDKFIAGTDCGFSTAVGALQVHPKVGWMKIDSLVQGAKLASERLTRAGA